MHAADDCAIALFATNKDDAPHGATDDGGAGSYGGGGGGCGGDGVDQAGVGALSLCVCRCMRDWTSTACVHSFRLQASLQCRTMSSYRLRADDHNGSRS